MVLYYTSLQITAYLLTIFIFNLTDFFLSSAEPPPPPQDLQAVQIKSNSVRLVWEVQSQQQHIGQGVGGMSNNNNNKDRHSDTDRRPQQMSPSDAAATLPITKFVIEVAPVQGRSAAIEL